MLRPPTCEGPRSRVGEERARKGHSRNCSGYASQAPAEREGTASGQLLLARSQEQVRSRPTYSAPAGALVTLLVTTVSVRDGPP